MGIQHLVVLISFALMVVSTNERPNAALIHGSFKVISVSFQLQNSSSKTMKSNFGEIPGLATFSAMRANKSWK